MSALKEKTGYLFENVWTVPNLLSFIRILLVPIFAVLFMKGYYKYLLIWNFSVINFYINQNIFCSIANIGHFSFP